MSVVMVHNFPSVEGKKSKRRVSVRKTEAGMVTEGNCGSTTAVLLVSVNEGSPGQTSRVKAKN